MKHKFNILDRPDIPSLCQNCWELISVDKRNEECVPAYIVGKAGEEIKKGSMVKAILSPTTGMVTIVNAKADEDTP